MSNTISVSELKSRIDAGDSIQLIDVRSAGEFAAGHVPKASNIPLEQLETRLGDLQSGTIAVLCQSGTRAGMACEQLSQHRGDLLLVKGGTKAWADAGYSVVKSGATTWALERQVRLVAGLLVLLGTTLSLAVSPLWIGLAIFVGAGLTFAGLTDICGMALILRLMPWNKQATCATIPGGDRR